MTHTKALVAMVSNYFIRSNISQGGNINSIYVTQLKSYENLYFGLGAGEYQPDPS